MNFAFIRNRLRIGNWRPRPPDDRHRLGRLGERAAARFLRKARHRVLAKNYRCLAGEIDLIYIDGDTIVFTEVKTRSAEDEGRFESTIRRGQWSRIEQAARFFLARCALQDKPCRFDFITVAWPSQGKPRIEHFKDAYQARRS